MLNLSLSNIKSVKAIHSTTVRENIDFTITLVNGDVVEFSQLSATMKLRGTAKLNGKRVAVKEALSSASWYAGLNTRFTYNDSYSAELLSKTLYVVDGKLTFEQPEKKVEDMNQGELFTIERKKKYESFQQMVEHELYIAIRDLTEYDHVYYGALNSAMLNVAVKYKQKGWREVVEYFNSLLTSIRLEIAGYKAINPQFNRIAKGVVLNFLAKHSTYFRDLYKEVQVERQVSYTADTYIERLVGYFSWMRKEEYDMDDLKERIVRFNMREKKHIAVEGEELRNTLNDVYKQYMSNIRNLNKLTKYNIINAVKSVQMTS